MSKLSAWWRRRNAPLFIKGMELHVINHCNISCRGCNHAAPGIAKWSLEPEQLRRDLALLGRHATCGTLRVIGGEPLLHPRLVELLEIIRASGLYKAIDIITNGTLLDRMPDRFWELIDLVKVSKYPNVKVTIPPGREAKVMIDDIPSFNEVHSTKRNDDRAMVRRIWDECWMKQSCAGIIDGHFHRCMRSGYIAQLVGLPPDTDAIPLSKLSKEAIMAQQANTQPLAACSWCTGNNGKEFGHELVPRKVWLTYQEKPIADMVDFTLKGRPSPMAPGEPLIVQKTW